MQHSVLCENVASPLMAEGLAVRVAITAALAADICRTWEVPSTKLSDEGGVSENRTRKPILQSPSQRKPQRSATFSFSSIATTPKKEQDKRAVSPHRFPLLRSGSVAIRPSSISRPTTPSKSRVVSPMPKREDQTLENNSTTEISLQQNRLFSQLSSLIKGAQSSHLPNLVGRAQIQCKSCVDGNFDIDQSLGDAIHKEAKTTT
ncbi:unnamed protein product [Arabidopsis arenosa]|uniref:Uncharacterized protein n=1 Tax=Arabidopsis arenosa TaxID=38785 RepID=A0A8S1ZHS0_ARAAE|nr:unnamed protein product [Arabidopsis arenosa]